MNYTALGKNMGTSYKCNEKKKSQSPRDCIFYDSVDLKCENKSVTLKSGFGRGMDGRGQEEETFFFLIRMLVTWCVQFVKNDQTLHS